MTSSLFYKEYRCPNDQKLLFKGILINSEVEVKCRLCKQLILIQGEAENKYICKKHDCPFRAI